MNKNDERKRTHKKTINPQDPKYPPQPERMVSLFLPSFPFDTVPRVRPVDDELVGRGRPVVGDAGLATLIVEDELDWLVVGSIDDCNTIWLGKGYIYI